MYTPDKIVDVTKWIFISSFQIWRHLGVSMINSGGEGVNQLQLPNFFPYMFLSRNDSMLRKKTIYLDLPSKGCWMDNVWGAKNHHPLGFKQHPLVLLYAIFKVPAILGGGGFQNALLVAGPTKI